jgi:hypothetical protein
LRRNSRTTLQREVAKIIAMIIALITSVTALAREPLSTPVFLKFGFSTVVEFEETPTEIVIGNSQLFQIEQLRKSLVIRPTTKSASTNAFVYFKKAVPRLLILTASDETKPNYYRLVEESYLPKTTVPLKAASPRNKKQTSAVGMRVGRIEFRVPHDYLTVDVTITANSSREISPRWDLARLNFRGRHLVPSKVWSARRTVSRDSTVKARFIFTKPDIPGNLSGVSLKLPQNTGEALVLNLGGSR